MIRKILNLIYEALSKMVGYKTIIDAYDLEGSAMSDEMSDAIDLWKDIYKDKSPWIDDIKGVYSLGLGKQICQTMQQQVLSEMETSITSPGEDSETDQASSDEKMTRSRFLNEIYQKRIIKKLPDALEKALALGGMIIKPYMNDGNVYLDFTYQGDFCPLAFDDDGNIIDIAFFDQFTSGKYVFTKVERQTFSQKNKMVVIENKAFKAEIKKADDEEEQQLGKEIKLAEVENSVYRLANNIRKTQKRANALQNISIPRFEATVKMITEALDEKDREEFSRQKVIKAQKNRQEAAKRKA